MKELLIEKIERKHTRVPTRKEGFYEFTSQFQT